MLRPSSPTSLLSPGRTWAATALVVALSGLCSALRGVTAQVGSCQSHSECGIQQFCATHPDTNDGWYCEPCDNCLPGGWIPPFDGACPENCRCTSHQQCGALVGRPDIVIDGAALALSVKGLFCAPAQVADSYFASDGPYVVSDLEGAFGPEWCHSCALLADVGIFAPADDDWIGIDDQSPASGPSENHQPSSCPDIPCLCAESSDCPDDHFCASDATLYAPYNSIPGPFPDGSMGPCRGYCVKCSLGCVDELIVYPVNGTVSGNSTGDDDGDARPVTCQDVCNPEYVQCETHAECQDFDGSLDGDDELETRWCSINHQCNACSIGCAENVSLSVNDFAFPSMDGTCPSGCCGWGLTRGQLWHKVMNGVIAPCGATYETEIYASVVVAYRYSYSPRVDDFLISPYACSMNESQYWEHSPSPSPSPSGNATLPSSATAGEQGPRLERKAAHVDCFTTVYNIPCDDYSRRVLYVGILMRTNSTDDYRFIVEPVFVDRNSVGCGTAEGSNGTSSTGMGSTVTILVITFGILGGLALLIFCASCNLRDSSTGAGSAASRAYPTPSILPWLPQQLPMANPVSISDLAAGAPPPPKANPTTESSFGGTTAAAGPTAPMGPSPGPSSDTVESDDEA